MEYPSPQVIFLAGLIIGAISSYLAIGRNRDPYIWFVYGALFGIVALFVLFLLPSRNEEVIVLKEEIKPVFTDCREWFYLNDLHEQQGPISYEKLQALHREGVIKNTTYVWAANMADWTVFSALPQK